MSRPNAHRSPRHAYFDEGGFLADLTVASRSRAQVRSPERAAALQAYLADEMCRRLRASDLAAAFSTIRTGPPVLAAERIEDPSLVTVLV